MDSFFGISNENIFLSFKGVLTSQNMEEILLKAEKKLMDTSSDPGISKRTFAVFIEFLQNLFHHAADSPRAESNPKMVELYFYKDLHNYHIQSTNYILNNNIPPLKAWIDQINSYSPEEIKKFYTYVLQNSDFSDKGGANLGLIDITRKAKNKLSYRFEKINNETSYFILKTSILFNPVTILKKKKTKSSPELNFSPATGHLRIHGRSIPENAYAFYTPVIGWLDNYANHSMELTVLEIFIDYINTGSAKYFIEIFKRLQKIVYWENKKVLVQWYYEKGDTDMFETGKDYEELTNLQFELIEK